jgi:hypothetical protein
MNFLNNAQFCHPNFLVMWHFYQKHLGFFHEGLKVIPILSHQEGVNNNSSINPIANNYQINPICIEDSIALETELDNVLASLNVGEIKDLDLIEQLGFDEFGLYTHVSIL